MTTPTLRFKEFDGDWVSSPLKKFFPKIRNGFVGIATPYYVANGVKYLQGKNVKDGSIDPTGLIYISEEFHTKKSNSKLAIDDILMVQSGHVGECAVIDKEYDNANCHALIVLSPHKEQETNSHFVKYYFYTPIGKKIISQIKTGNTIEHVLASEVKEIYLNFPSKAEQTKIASFLSVVDEKINQLTQKHQLLTQYKQGMMQKLFSQQIRFKADDGSEFREWKIGKLGDITSIQGGFAFKSTNFGKGMTKVIRIGDIEKNINLDSFTGIYSNEIPDTRYLISENAIVMALSGATFGKLGKVNQGYAYINQRVATFKVFEDSLNEFVYQIMLSQEFTTYIQSIPSASAQPNISNQDVINFEMMIPCLEEQTKIANFLSAIDQKIEVTEQQIEQAKQWKKGLLQQMFV